MSPAPRKKLALALVAVLSALAIASLFARRRAPAAPRAAASGASSASVDAPPLDSSGDVRVALATPRGEVRTRAEAGLAGARDAVLGRCPAARAGRTFVVDATFDAAGAMVMRDVKPRRGEAADELVACVAEALPRFRIAAPGSNTHVVVEWTLP